MAFTKEQLRAKAKGFATAFSKMTAKQREEDPSSSVITDYNKLRDLVLNLYPKLEEIIPPSVKWGRVESQYKDSGIEDYNVPTAKYQDIHAYAEQILGLLDATGPALPRTRMSRGP